MPNDSKSTTGEVLRNLSISVSILGIVFNVLLLLNQTRVVIRGHVINRSDNYVRPVHSCHFKTRLLRLIVTTCVYL